MRHPLAPGLARFCASRWWGVAGDAERSIGDALSCASWKGHVFLKVARVAQVNFAVDEDAHAGRAQGYCLTLP